MIIIPPSDGYPQLLVALCNDGTMWRKRFDGGVIGPWKPIEFIPDTTCAEIAAKFAKPTDAGMGSV